MKLSDETLEIMGDFSRINMSLLVRPGKKLRTVSPNRNVFAIANIPEQFKTEFAIYDLRQLLSTMSLFEQPELVFGEAALTISNGSGATAKYTYAAKEAIIAAPEKDINVPTPEIEFFLKGDDLEGALKAASVLGLPEIAFEGRNGKTLISAIDSKNDAAHTWDKVLDEEAKAKYRIVFRVESMKILKRDYDVQVSTKGIARLSSQKGDVTYYIAAEGDVQYKN